MDRRRFLKAGIHKATDTAVAAAETHARRRAQRWIRPPYALDELSFLTTCTRCGDCIAACPHGVIFALPARLGAQVVGTPALDLLHNACALCEAWPCVVSCEPGALRRPPTSASDEAEAATSCTPLPQLAKAAIDPTTCLPYRGPECGACGESCPVAGALVWSGETPRIDPDLCVGCAQCRSTCITDPPAIAIRSVYHSDT